MTLRPVLLALCFGTAAPAPAGDPPAGAPDTDPDAPAVRRAAGTPLGSVLEHFGP